MPAPDGPQWMDVFHASYEHVPPHLRDYEDMNYYTNSDPDVIHMGTAKTIGDYGLRSRPYVHTYSVPTSHLYPVTFGDEQQFLDADNFGLDTSSEFNKAMKGVQEGLFETIPGDPRLAITSNTVVPYRNREESPGSLSYMVPKKLIASGDVKYKGVSPTWHVEEI